jgi:hypothetical protein
MSIRVLLSVELCVTLKTYLKGAPFYNACESRPVCGICKRWERSGFRLFHGAAFAHAFGRPQDIEWAIEGDQLFLLQSPPIATLRDLADPEGALNLWDNSNITESYNGVTTLLTFSFARYVYEGFTTVALPRASGLKKPAVAQRK